jgi:hypothetical protein
MRILALHCTFTKDETFYFHFSIIGTIIPCNASILIGSGTQNECKIDPISFKTQFL